MDRVRNEIIRRMNSWARTGILFRFEEAIPYTNNNGALNQPRKINTETPAEIFCSGKVFLRCPRVRCIHRKHLNSRRNFSRLPLFSFTRARVVIHSRADERRDTDLEINTCNFGTEPDLSRDINVLVLSSEVSYRSKFCKIKQGHPRHINFLPDTRSAKETVLKAFLRARF